MLVVDTNVVVRYLTNDDHAQAARARRLLVQHDVLVPPSGVGVPPVELA